MSRLSFSPNRVLALVALCALAACGPVIAVRPPSAEETAGVAQGTRAIVLFRHTVTRDSQPYKVLEPGWLSIASIDRGESPPYLTDVASPSAEAEDAGWSYAVLAPGTYYLLILPPGTQQNPPAVAFHTESARYGRLATGELRLRGDAYWYPDLQRFLINGTPPPDFTPIPGFWFHVPAGEPIVYLGSVSVACGTIPGLLGRLTDSCRAFDVADETAAARAIAERAFAGQGAMSTRLMARLGTANRRVARHALFPMGLRTDLAAVEATAGFAGRQPGHSFLLPGAGALPGAPGQAIGVFNVLLLLGQATAAAEADTAARERAEKWAPCLKDLSARLPFAELAAELPAAFDGAVVGAGGRPTVALDAGPVPAAATVLEARFLGAGLRECVDRGTLCVEVSMRVRLTDATGTVPIYDSVLIYSNAYRSDPRKTSYRLYHVPTPDASPCRAIEAYCGPGGLETVRREIAAGIRAIAAKAAKDILGPVQAADRR